MLARLAVSAAFFLFCLLWAPLAASADHSVDSAGGHVAEDSVTHTPSEEIRLEKDTASATQADAKLAAAAVAGDEHLRGQWGPVEDWPVVGIHVALLPNGKVLAYDSVLDHSGEHNYTQATVWDPATGAHTPVNVGTGFNVFCSGLAHLPNGSLFLAGGNRTPENDGIKQTHIFNPSTNTWSLGPDMAYERWYPSVTPLSNGEMLITEGRPPIPEVRTSTGARARELPDAARGDLYLYPWLDVAPDGRAFYSGPYPTMRKLDTAGRGDWQEFGQREAPGLDRNYGSHALYDIGKILVAGGGRPPKASARAIDVNGAIPQASDAGSMAFPRRQHNLTVLADGSVLATGGLSSDVDLVDLNNGVYPAELWTPPSLPGPTGWSTLAAMQETRQYHSTALLLPDGRVLSSGGGVCGDCDEAGYLAKNAEVFTPPYLFKKDGSGQLAPRPTISSAPGAVNYAAPLQISTPNPASIEKMALVRLGAVTHSVNMEQRYIPLSITGRGAGTLTATGPANGNIAPPGPYMLFAIDANGVPSIARQVTVAGGNPPPNRSPVAVLDANPASGSAPLNVSFAGGRSSDPDGDSLSYSWSFGDGGTSSAAATAHRYSTPGAYTARLTVSDNRGRSSTATRTISVGNAPSGPPGGGPSTPGGPSPGGPSPGGPSPGGPSPGGPSPGGPIPGDTSPPGLRLLGVNAARGRIRGSAADKSGVDSVRVALRRTVRGGGCSWWLRGRRRMSAGGRPCDKPRWMDAQLSTANGGVRWLLTLGRSLPPGNYRVLVRAIDGEGNQRKLPAGPGSIARVARR